MSDYNQNQVTELVSSLFSLRRAKMELEKSEKGILDQLKPIVDPSFEVDRVASLLFGSLQLKRVEGVNSRVDPQLLLDRGVAPDVIDSCTKRVSYFQYRVTEMAKS